MNGQKGKALRPSASPPARPPDGIAFELVPIEDVREHEEIEEEVLRYVLGEFRKDGGVREPILVSRGDHVVLNGHHRLAALRQLHAKRVPAWVVDYQSDIVTVERWPGSTYPGPVTKDEVVAHAREGHLFPPKTTRHQLHVELPPKNTPLRDLV
ncbi:MAG: ParB N-terminal domain-containing protein [Euryarchaeota archaeon]|nr:ParB N-terminal domain-containing protein [Euryarchaeota archaeon]MDE1838038.1 ParB N-terminal domain-containing protein [Euryarchaeota archaeon]MDE2046651.1 ParB N-terminal domain-containing protein [Thermoplasmata archaeon]